MDTPTLLQKTVTITKVRIRPECTKEFVDWQTRIHQLIAGIPGFVSLEISSNQENSKTVWSIVQRFNDADCYSNWKASGERQALLQELRKIAVNNGSDSIQEDESGLPTLQAGVTEMFVTEVSPDKEAAFQKWIAKIHKVEAQFPGFRGLYVQSPAQNGGKNWITFLKFDTPEHLENWLSSPERAQVLEESKPLIASLESHRVISPFSGWFSSLTSGGETVPLWKQTMVILLVLFPIIMFELKYLTPNLKGLNISLATFIGNAISVVLISWPMMPIAIHYLSWWLSPKGADTNRIAILGTAVVAALYLIEIALFWNLLP